MDRIVAVGFLATFRGLIASLLALMCAMLVSAACAEEFDTCRLHGTVADAQGRPLTDAKVGLNRFEGALGAPDNVYQTATGEDGAYELKVRFAKGETLIVREVFADKRGFVRGAPPLETPLRNGEAAEIDFRLDAGEPLAGQLHLPLQSWERRLAADKVVRVLEVAGPTIDQMTINARCHLVGAAGKFELYVPSGRYTLRVINYSSAPAEWKDIEAPAKDLVLKLPPFEWSQANLGKAFDELCEVMDRNYSYFFLKKDVDWQRLRGEYRAAAARDQCRGTERSAARNALSLEGHAHLDRNAHGNHSHLP